MKTFTNQNARTPAEAAALAQAARRDGQAVSFAGGGTDLLQLVKLTSTNAARIFGMYPQKGTIQKGSDADITLIDLKKEQKVTSDLFGAFSDYVVYEGWNLKGWPITTLLRGSTVTENMQVVGKPGYGKLVRRA